MDSSQPRLRAAIWLWQDTDYHRLSLTGPHHVTHPIHPCFYIGESINGLGTDPNASRQPYSEEPNVYPMESLNVINPSISGRRLFCKVPPTWSFITVPHHVSHPIHPHIYALYPIDDALKAFHNPRFYPDLWIGRSSFAFRIQRVHGRGTSVEKGQISMQTISSNIRKNHLSFNHFVNTPFQC
ncbi:hypothetical protein BD779DRAFT_236135 [Infundibulicybe gibba]|nr:hypothetical protein BD779DRAFT_236135 [Infundibulicybe gibba]